MLEYTIETIRNMGTTLLMFIDSVVSIGLWAFVGYVVFLVVKSFKKSKK